MERIRTGDIAVDLYRPADLQLWWLAGDLGRAAFHLLGRGVLPMVLGALCLRPGAAARSVDLAGLPGGGGAGGRW